MWATAVSWIVKHFSGCGYAICGIVCFVFGAYVSHLNYSAELLRMSEQSYLRQVELQKERNEALAQVVSKQVELDNWRRSNAQRISDLTKRVQLAEDRRKRAEQATGSVTVTDEGRCRNLLVRGAEVVGRCSDVLGDAVKRHDALIEFNK